MQSRQNASFFKELFMFVLLAQLGVDPHQLHSSTNVSRAVSVEDCINDSAEAPPLEVSPSEHCDSESTTLVGDDGISPSSSATPVIPSPIEPFLPEEFDSRAGQEVSPPAISPPASLSPPSSSSEKELRHLMDVTFFGGVRTTCPLACASTAASWSVSSAICKMDSPSCRGAG